MLALFLFIVLVCVVAGLIGAVIHGLVWITVIAAVIFIVNLLLGGTRLRHKARTR